MTLVSAQELTKFGVSIPNVNQKFGLSTVYLNDNEIAIEPDQENIDIIVMTSRGSESHFDFGSVSDRVIKCTDKPTVIIPG